MWIFILLDNLIEVHLFEKRPTDGLLVNGREYIRATHEKGAVGHIDWLRLDGQVLGCRVWHFIDGAESIVLDRLLSFLKKRDYASVPHDESCFCVFFKKDRRFNENASCDQDLSESGLYQSESGFALYIDTSTVPLAEVESITNKKRSSH